MIFIDGKPIPTNGKTLFNSAVFIRQHLRPDSVISIIDYEGIYKDGNYPTYDSLMSYSDMVLGPLGFNSNRRRPFTVSPISIRQACAALCGYVIERFNSRRHAPAVCEVPMALSSSIKPPIKKMVDEAGIRSMSLAEMTKGICNGTVQPMMVIDSLMPSSDPLDDNEFVGSTKSKLKEDEE